MKILIAIIIFSAIILFHEFGHFLFAKLNGISVTEFSLGMGPRLWSFQKGETRYSLKLLPLGGSCAMVGEDTAEKEIPGSFNAASVWGRISVVAAGPIFNFILAFVLAVIFVGFVGYDPAEVLEVDKNSAAAEAGLQNGDIITEYDGYHVDLAKDLYVYMYLNDLKEGDTVTLKVRRDGRTETISYTPDVSVRYLLGFNRSDASSMTVESLIDGMPLQEAGLQPGDTITAINGVEIADGEAYDAYLAEHPLSSESVEITYDRDGLDYTATITPKEYRTPQLGFSYNLGYTKTSGLRILKYGALEIKYMIRTTLLSLKELVTGQLGFQNLSGPVGVVDAIGTTYEESKSEGTFLRPRPEHVECFVTDRLETSRPRQGCGHRDESQYLELMLFHGFHSDFSALRAALRPFSPTPDGGSRASIRTGGRARIRAPGSTDGERSAARCESRGRRRRVCRCRSGATYIGHRSFV